MNCILLMKSYDSIRTWLPIVPTRTDSYHTRKFPYGATSQTFRYWSGPVDLTGCSGNLTVLPLPCDDNTVMETSSTFYTAGTCCNSIGDE